MTEFELVTIRLTLFFVLITINIVSMVYTFKTPYTRIEASADWKLRAYWYLGFATTAAYIIGVVIAAILFLSFTIVN